MTTPKFVAEVAEWLEKVTISYVCIFSDCDSNFQISIASVNEVYIKEEVIDDGHASTSGEHHLSNEAENSINIKPDTLSSVDENYTLSLVSFHAMWMSLK